MKKQIFLLGISLCCFAASAQPTSFGGVTPGKTTREELKSLVKAETQSDLMLGYKDAEKVVLKRFEGRIVNVLLQNDVVYEVRMGLSSFLPDLKQALIEKYGQPNIRVGAIRTVNCQNKFGASFKRLEGKERLLWQVKDGVQGEIERDAGDCSEEISESYVLRHVATVQAIQEKWQEKTRKEWEEKRRKMDGAL